MSWGFESVTVELAGTTALDSIDLEVIPGGVTAVVGGDGAGKTTTSRTLAGLARVSTGRVRRPAAVGYQPETSGVWVDLTVTENLEFVATVYRTGPTEGRRRIDELLELTALGAARHRLGGALSGGMRQKLGVAMALLPRPELLILDEPTTGLDPVSRLDLWVFISAAAASGTAVLMTSSYLDEAERAHAIYALDSGRVLARGDMASLREAVPGRVLIADHPIDAPHRWRKGRSWHIWSPSGVVLDGTEAVTPDLEDLVTVAALGRRDR